jgi:hypothetical protein
MFIHPNNLAISGFVISHQKTANSLEEAPSFYTPSPKKGMLLRT